MKKILYILQKAKVKNVDGKYCLGCQICKYIGFSKENKNIIVALTNSLMQVEEMSQNLKTLAVLTEDCV